MFVPTGSVSDSVDFIPSAKTHHGELYLCNIFDNSFTDLTVFPEPGVSTNHRWSECVRPERDHI